VTVVVAGIGGPKWSPHRPPNRSGGRRDRLGRCGNGWFVA